jgi:hypothetical protein
MSAQNTQKSYRYWCVIILDSKTKINHKSRHNEKNERLKPLESFVTMQACKGLSKMSFKKAVKVAQSVKV